MEELQLRRVGEDEPLSLILKVVGETCNINCTYCYEKRKPYEDSRFMLVETLSRLLAKLGRRPLSVQLHGGEPMLLGIERTASVLKRLREYPGRVHLSIQTNATLLNEEWLDLFEEGWPDIEIGVSLDGPESTSLFRVDYNMGSTHSRVLNGLELLRRRNWKTGIICVVTRLALGHPAALVRFFGEFDCVKVVNFAPCLDYDVETTAVTSRNREHVAELNGAGRGSPGWATTPGEYAQFVMDVYGEWRSGGLFRQYAVEPITSLIRSVSELPVRFCHFSWNKCSSVLTLYPNGAVGGCDEFRLEDSTLGHTNHSQLAEMLAPRGIARHRAADVGRLLQQCNACDYESTCRGGCLATRLAYQSTEHEEEYCRSRAALVDFVSRELGLPEKTRKQGWWQHRGESEASTLRPEEVT